MSREQTLGFQVLSSEIENILSFAHLCQARGCCEGRWDDLLFYNHMLSASTLVHLYNQQHNSRIWHWLQSSTFIVEVCLDQMYFKVYHLVLPPEVSPQSLSKDATLLCVSVTKPFFSVFQDPGIVGSARTPHYNIDHWWMGRLLTYRQHCLLDCPLCVHFFKYNTWWTH